MKRYALTISLAYNNFPKKNKITRCKYVAALRDFFYELSKLIIYERFSYKIPSGLGSLRIAKRKNNSKLHKNKIDYGVYNKTGKIVYLTNLHTNNYYFFWFWNKINAVFKYRSVYEIVPNRGNDGVIGTRGLSAYIKKCSESPLIKDYNVLEVI